MALWPHCFSRQPRVVALFGLLLLLGLALSGCGGGGGGGNSPATGGQSAPPPTTATLQFDFDLAARQVPVDVQHLRISGYNQQGILVYGPVTRGKASQIVLTNVPVEVTSVRVEYLDGAEVVVGLYAEGVELAPGVTKVIVDPPYEDFNNPPSLSRIEVAPATASVAAGIEQQFTAVAVFTDGFRQVLTRDAAWSVADGNIASVSTAVGTRGLAKGLVPGSTAVKATYAGVTGEATLTVTSAQLVSLAVTPNTASVPAGRTQQFVATGAFTDNSTADLTDQVRWSSSNTAIATVTNVDLRGPAIEVAGAGLATGKAQGQATITATHQASGKSGTAGLTVTAAVLTSIAIAPTNPSVAKGRTQQFTATGTFSDNTTQDITAQVNWTSGAASIASVSNLAGSRGLVSTHAVGDAVITATDPTTSLSGTSTVIVTAAVLDSIAIAPTNPSVPKGRTQQFAAVGTYSDNTTQDLTGVVTWSSSSPTTASISNDAGSNGLATALATGQATITATDPTTSKTGSTLLSVTPAALVSIAVTPPQPAVAKGRTQQFTATGTFTDSSTKDVTQDVTWSSSNTASVTISNAAGTKGLASGVAVGQANIVATDSATQITGSATLTVTPAVLVSLSVTPPSPLVPLGVQQQMTATGTFSDNTTQDLTNSVTWSSLDQSIATVSSTGLVTPVALGGPITIRAIDAATSVQGDASVEVVAAALASIAVTPVNPTLAKGRGLQFTATGTFSDQSTRDLTGDVTWSSSNTAVANIANNVSGRQVVLGVGAGYASALTTGNTTITATWPGTQIAGSTTLTVTAAELVSLAILPDGPSVPKGLGQQFQVTGTFSDNTTADLTANVTWSSSNETVATISNAAGSKGAATTVAVGETTITALDPGTGISDTTLLTVTAAALVSVAVTPADASVEQLKTQQFTATGTYTDQSTQDLTQSVTWSSTSESIATISNAAGTKGLATAAAVGQTTITATDPGTSKSGSTGLTVTEPPPPQITVVFKNGCGGTAVPPEVAGLTVQFVNQVTYQQVNGTLDANGRAVFTRDQVSPNVTWSARILAGNGCAKPAMRFGCWDGTHTGWGAASTPPTGEPAGELWLYINAPGDCFDPPLPPVGSSRWGNQATCSGD